MTENFRWAVISALVGLLAGGLAWGAASSWGSAPLSPALTNHSSIMDRTSQSGSGMMGRMMQQGMGSRHSMMNPGHRQGMQRMMHSSEHEKMMGEPMAQCHQMMAMMQEHIRPSSSEEK